MEEDFLHESDLFASKEFRQLKTGFNWLLVLLIAGFGVSFFHLIMRVVYDNNFYRTASSIDIQKMTFIYKAFAGLFALMNLALYTIAAIKVNNALGRTFIIVIGVFHIVSYVYYQFFD